MEEKMFSCEVCKQERHKYKCPKCRLKYCSVSCFKTHKETDCRVPVVESSNHQINNTENVSKDILEDGELSSEDEVDFEESEDKVTKDKLASLSENEDLKSMLNNPHLQNMLKSLTNADNPSEAIDKAMQEPIFVELVDQCLRTVEPEKTSHLLV